THLWLIGPHLFPVPGLTLLLLMKPRFFPVPGHTPVSNWTSSLPVLNRALKNMQCWIISSLTWTPLLPRFSYCIFPACLFLPGFLWILDLTLCGFYWTALDCASSPGLCFYVSVLCCLPCLVEISMFCIF